MNQKNGLTTLAQRRTGVLEKKESHTGQRLEAQRRTGVFHIKWGAADGPELILHGGETDSPPLAAAAERCTTALL